MWFWGAQGADVSDQPQTLRPNIFDYADYENDIFICIKYFAWEKIEGA